MVVVVVVVVVADVVMMMVGVITPNLTAAMSEMIPAPASHKPATYLLHVRPSKPPSSSLPSPLSLVPNNDYWRFCWGRARKEFKTGNLAAARPQNPSQISSTSAEVDKIRSNRN